MYTVFPTLDSHTRHKTHLQCLPTLLAITRTLATLWVPNCPGVDVILINESQINNGRVTIIDFHSGYSNRASGQSQLSDFTDTFERLGFDLYSVNIDEADDDVVLEADVRVVCKRKRGAALVLMVVVRRYRLLWSSKTETGLGMPGVLVGRISMSVNLCDSCVL